MPSADARHLPIGTNVKHYVIEATVGNGTFASVYLARDIRDGKRVALKVIANTSGRNLDTPARRLHHEVEILQRLNHPGICRVHELGDEQGVLFMAMDYVAGHTLDMEIRRLGKIPEARLIPIMRDVCRAVGAAHAEKILHRDLKPSNVVLNAKDIPTLLDFGHAIGPDISRVTASGSWVGTLQYMAPELIRDQPASVFSEIYALGAILYRCASGQYPFPGGTYAEVAARKLCQEVPLLSQAAPEALPLLVGIVTKSMQNKPAARFANVGELAEALDELVSGWPVKSAARPRPGAGNNPEKTPIPQPPAVATPHERYVWYVEAIHSTRRDKGVVVGDLPDVDNLERSAAFAASEGQIEDSLSSLRLAFEKLLTAAIDQTIVSKKIQRIDQLLREGGGYRHMAVYSPKLDRIMADFDERRYGDANRGLNEALAMLEVSKKNASRLGR